MSISSLKTSKILKNDLPKFFIERTEFAFRAWKKKKNKCISSGLYTQGWNREESKGERGIGHEWFKPGH